jgi:outer membrane protein assembly factor BamE
MEQRHLAGRLRLHARVHRLAACAMAAALAGCAQLTAPFDTYIPLITQFGIYKLDINQGNYISQDMVDKLKPGQTKAQVRTTLGTPLIASAFRDNRWDYVYEFQSGGRVREHRQFTVYFKDDLLARWEGDEMPKSVQEMNRIAATRSLPEDPYGQDAGIVGKIIDMFKRVVDPTAPPTP